MKWKALTKAERHTIRAMYPLHTIADIMRATGRSDYLIRKYVREHGLRHSEDYKRGTGVHLSAEHVEHIRVTLLTHCVSETARLCGVSKSTVFQQIRRNGWPRTEASKAEALRLITLPETSEKKRQAMLRTYEQERRRVLSGKRQNTGLRLTVLPKKVCTARYKLCSGYNYYTSGDPNECAVYYDRETRRNAHAEQYYAKKYGIRFISGEDNENENEENNEQQNLLHQD